MVHGQSFKLLVIHRDVIKPLNIVPKGSPLWKSSLALYKMPSLKNYLPPMSPAKQNTQL